ncbi:MAG: hypothetical protein AABZ29_01935 [Gemmatimonadota bacterium]|mgnify:FL=1
MTRFFRVAMAPLAFAAVLTACGKNDEAVPESRQVELTPTPVAQAQLGDTAIAPAIEPAAEPKVALAKKPVPTPQAAAPAAPAPTQVAPQPAPVSTSSAPATGLIAGGMSLGATLGTRVCTNTYKVGDRVTATLASAVPGTNGASIPAGATVTLRVSESQRGENGKEGIRLAFAPVSVTFGGSTYPIDGTAVMTQMETVRAQTTGDQAKKVATGAAVGAIAGQILGKRAKTAAIGAVVGAAAGGAVAAGSADWNACLGDGARLTITLDSPVTVKVLANNPGI